MSKRRRVHVLGLRMFASTIPKASNPLVEPGEACASILVQNISGIGNALMATPLLAELRRLYPKAQIDLLTTPESAELLSNDPHVSSIIGDPFVRFGKIRDYLRIRSQLRRKRYDICLLTITAVDIDYVQRIVLSRIPIRVIHAYELHRDNNLVGLCSHKVKFDQTRHDVENNLDLLRALTPAQVNAGKLELHLTEADHAAAKRFLREREWCEDRPTIGFCPGSTLRWSCKRWPNGHYVKLAERLLASYPGMQILAFCGPDEVEDGALLEKESDGLITPVHGLGLRSYASAMSLCDVVVSGDSLPIHICAALEVPLVALFGPTDPRRTGPWMTRATVLTPDCDFIPFYRMPYPPDPSQYPPCMPLITVDSVEAAIDEMLHGQNQT